MCRFVFILCKYRKLTCFLCRFHNIFNFYRLFSCFMFRIALICDFLPNGVCRMGGSAIFCRMACVECEDLRFSVKWRSAGGTSIQGGM